MIIWATPTAPLSCAVDAANNRATYNRGSVQLSGAFYRPSGNGPFPAVLVLHTRGGLGGHERTTASWLASQGFVALAPDYFTPVGVTPQSWQGSTFYVQHTDRIREDLALGLGCLKSLPYAAPRQIAVMGSSLGGYFGFLLGTRDDVKGVVSYYGAYHGRPVDLALTPYSFADIVAQLSAPVLMFHGDADADTPVRLATAVRDLLERNSKSFELIVYPGADHGFDQVRAPQYNPVTAADAQARTLAFLRARLN